MHSLGISHRDIKPENIVCSQDGTRVRICDFGLATSEERSSELVVVRLFTSHLVSLPFLLTCFKRHAHLP